MPVERFRPGMTSRTQGLRLVGLAAAECDDGALDRGCDAVVGIEESEEQPGATGELEHHVDVARAFLSGLQRGAESWLTIGIGDGKVIERGLEIGGDRFTVEIRGRGGEGGEEGVKLFDEAAGIGHGGRWLVVGGGHRPGVGGGGRQGLIVEGYGRGKRAVHIGGDRAIIRHRGFFGGRVRGGSGNRLVGV